VINDLTSLPTGRTESKLVHHVVEASLKKNEQLSTSYTLGACSDLEGVTELALKKSIGPLNLLLLSKLNLVVGECLTTTAMLTRTTFTLLNSALSSETSLTLQEELLSLSSAQATN
jgi:hypothetical protein